MELLKSRETELKRAAEVEFQAAKLEKETWESRKIEVETRLKEIEQSKKLADEKFMDEVTRHKRNLEMEME